MSRKKPLPLLTNIEIEDFAAEGKCLFHWNTGNSESEGKNLVVFVPFCVPGDIADIQIRRKKHSFAEGEVVRIVTPSPKRIAPKCEHFGLCGGCKWQNVPYAEQIAYKERQVREQLTRIGKIELPDFNPIKGSVKTEGYRNKLDFGCSNKRWLTKEEIGREDTIDTRNAIGFHITGAFDKILPINKCWLMDDLHNDIRNGIYQYAQENGITFFDLRQQVGLLRDIIIRCSNASETQEWMVIVQFHFDTPDDKEKAMGLLKYIAETFPQVTSLLYLDNQKCNDTIGDQEIITYKGNDHIFLYMEDLKFKVGPKSFYQTNTEQAYELYKVVRDFAFNCQLSNVNCQFPLVYDLYTGTGTIANFVAKRASKVIGIEYVPEAIEDAKINSEINGITNTKFFAGDMKDILTDDFIAEHGRPDIIITDPPRAGMHPDVVQTILNAKPQRIVYVSCNPATQARDLSMMDADYRVVEVQPVDMFPHTPHVENVVLLERRA
ncbi:MAG: 23S rRNA (uracil(1939)-C(5))-methyltransferase RlmD [Prevotella sp.]|nr:23S rRNA (uracil(1939)-C(5))-methyltransferase RlmD [Prevotella sp.]